MRDLQLRLAFLFYIHRHCVFILNFDLQARIYLYIHFCLIGAQKRRKLYIQNNTKTKGQKEISKVNVGPFPPAELTQNIFEDK